MRIKRRIFLFALFIGILGIAVINLLAYQHAKGFLTYSDNKKRSQSPETLSLSQKITILLTGMTIPKPLNKRTPDSLNLAYEIHDIGVSNTIRLEAWLIPHIPSKGIIVMFHGYGASKASLLPEAKAFYESGWTTFLVDFRGSGGSNQHTVSIGYHEAEDVAQVFLYLTQHFPKDVVCLYGRSMGSAAILGALSRHRITPDAIILESVFDKMLTTVKHRFVAMRIPSFPAAQLLVFWGGIQQGFWGFHHNPADYASAVNCPALLMHGENDPRVTVQEAKTVFNTINGQKHFEVFTAIGHQSYYLMYPEQWTRVVFTFLQENSIQHRQ